MDNNSNPYIPIPIKILIFSYLDNITLNNLLLVNTYINNIISANHNLYLVSQIIKYIQVKIGYDYFGMSYGVINKVQVVFSKCYKFNSYTIKLSKYNKDIIFYPYKNTIEFDGQKLHVNKTYNKQLQLTNSVDTIYIQGYNNMYTLQMKIEGPFQCLICPKINNVDILYSQHISSGVYG